MDDKMFQTQCSVVSKCVSGLSLTLVEAGGGDVILKIMHDVHKLLQSFKLLGDQYGRGYHTKCKESEMNRRELETKGRELEAKCRELETEKQKNRDLAIKLKRIESKCEFGHVGAQKPALISDVDSQCHTVGESQADMGNLPGSLQTLKITSEELKRSETGNVQESFSPCDFGPELLHIQRALDCRVFDEDTRAYLETLLKRSIKPVKKSVGTQTWSLQVTLATQTGHDDLTPIQAIGSSVKQGNSVQYLQCSTFRDSAEGSHMALEIIPEKQTKGGDNVDFGCNEGVNVWQSSDHFGATGRGCNKRQIEYVNLDSDSEESERDQNPNPWPKSRKLDSRQVPVGSQASKKINEVSEIMQERLVQEQSMVEDLSKMMEDYERTFLEKPIRQYACHDVGKG